jgi:hypothetical protein
MKALAIGILVLLTMPSLSFGGDKKLQEWLNAGSWSEGADYCNRKLADDLSRRPDLRSVSTEYLSRLAVYCAALASGQGDDRNAGWWWYTAVAIDHKAAEGLLPEMRKLGLLQALPPPRNLGPRREPNEKKKEIRLLSGEIVQGDLPRLLNKPKVPDYIFRPITGVAGATVAIEAIISRDGTLRQPLLVKAGALPVQVLFAYQFLSTFRFEPAKVNGEPVECFYMWTVSVRR